MKKLITVMFMSLLCLLSAAQDSVVVKGVVKDAQGMGLTGAHVKFVAGDGQGASSTVLSDTAGVFSIRLPQSKYLLSVSYVGLDTYEARIDALSDVQLPTITLDEGNHLLNGVEVTAKRITYNTKGYVANLANDEFLKERSLTDAMKLLPGLELIEGEFKAYKQNIGSVFVNNKRLNLSGPRAAQYLSHLSAKNVTAVEVLNSTADPTLSDHSAYVLRITTKRANDGGRANVGFGTSGGNVNDFQINPTAFIEQRTGKWSLFLMPQYQPRTMLKRGSKSISHYYQQNATRRETSVLKLKKHPIANYTLGAGYDINEKSTLSFTTSGYYDKHDQSQSTTNVMTRDGVNSTTEGFTTNNRKDKQFDGTIDYTAFLTNVTIMAYTQYLFNEKNAQNLHRQTLEEGLTTQNDLHEKTLYHMWLFNSSATWNVAKGHSFSAGVDMSTWDNSSDYLQYFDTNLQKYRYLYQEFQFSGRMSYTFRSDRFDLNVGTKWLHVNMKPKVEEQEQTTSFNRSVNKWMPYTTLTYVYNKKSMETVSLQYERTYDYSQLSAINPTVRWNSEYEYSQGNPNLRPGFTDKVSLQTSIHDFMIYTFFKNSLSYTMDVTVDDNGNQVISCNNGLHNQSIFAYLAFPTLNLSKKWRMQIHMDYLWSREHYQDLRRCSQQVTGGITTMADLPAGFSLEGTLSLSSPQRSLYQDAYVPGRVNGNIRKAFFKNKLSAVLSASYDFRTHSSVHSPLFRTDNRYDKAVFRVNFGVSYRFRWGNRRAYVKRNQVMTLESLRMKN